MVKRTLEVFECDKCGAEGHRYTMLYEDGAKVFDRCEKHNRKLEALREEEGEWREAKSGRAVFKKSSLEDVRRATKSTGT